MPSATINPTGTPWESIANRTLLFSLSCAGYRLASTSGASAVRIGLDLAGFNHQPGASMTASSNLARSPSSRQRPSAPLKRTDGRCLPVPVVRGRLRKMAEVEQRWMEARKS